MGSQIAKCHAFSAQVVGFTEVSRATLEPRAWSRGQRNDILRRVALGTGMGELLKADIKTAAPFLFANKNTVKHAAWSNSCRL